MRLTQLISNYQFTLLSGDTVLQDGKPEIRTGKVYVKPSTENITFVVAMKRRTTLISDTDHEIFLEELIKEHLINRMKNNPELSVPNTAICVDVKVTTELLLHDNSTVNTRFNYSNLTTYNLFNGE